MVKLDAIYSWLAGLSQGDKEQSLTDITLYPYLPDKQPGSERIIRIAQP